MNQIEYVKSNKGGLKIIHNGYLYTVHKTKKCGGIRWRCSQRSLNCKGSISTNLLGIPQVNMPHNHLPDYRLIYSAKCKSQDPSLNLLLNKMADTSAKKARKSNFSPEEVEVLVATVTKHYNILYGEFAKRAINKHARQRVWLDVTKQVNRVSVERRTLQEVKNKWKKCQHLYKGPEIPEDFVASNVWEPLTTIKGLFTKILTFMSAPSLKLKMKSKSKHRSSNKNNRIKIRQCTVYEPDFKKAVVLYAEQKSTSEARRRYGISESNIRRWRRLRNDIMEKASQPKSSRKSKKTINTYVNTFDDVDLFEFSSSLDSMPLEQRLSKISTEQEPVLQSQPLSPTKLKVTRQSTRPQPSPKPPTPQPVNEEVCLRWNSHHFNMQTTFPNLLLREQYVDATLVAEGQTLKCHRLILSSCSPYFEEVLSGISPFQHPILFMKDIPFWILKSLCDFMYAGEVHIFQNKLEELLAVAESLKIKGLAGKTEGTGEEVRTLEPIKSIKDEFKKDEKDVKDKKRQISLQQMQVSEMPVLKTATKNLRSTYNSRRTERSEKIREPLKKDIVDPLDLLEPVYEELTKESSPTSVPAKSRDSKSIPVKKGLAKKVRKRKFSEEREESPPPLFLSRKGTRSRPNVKIPKYYHTHYDRTSKLDSESTIVREPHTDQADPLLHVSEIKAEPLDLEDDVIEIEDNVVSFSDHEEIFGNYDSPLVNVREETAGERSKEEEPPAFKKISLLPQPIIMNVHSVAEKAEDMLQIVDVTEIRGTKDDKNDDPLATELFPSEQLNKTAEDPLNLHIVSEPTSNITITNVESISESEMKEPGEGTVEKELNVQQDETPLQFRIENVMSGCEPNGESETDNFVIGFKIKDVMSQNETMENAGTESEEVAEEKSPLENSELDTKTQLENSEMDFSELDPITMEVTPLNDAQIETDQPRDVAVEDTTATENCQPDDAAMEECELDNPSIEKSELNIIAEENINRKNVTDLKKCSIEDAELEIPVMENTVLDSISMENAELENASVETLLLENTRFENPTMEIPIVLNPIIENTEKELEVINIVGELEKVMNDSFDEKSAECTSDLGFQITNVVSEPLDGIDEDLDGKMLENEVPINNELENIVKDLSEMVEESRMGSANVISNPADG